MCFISHHRMAHWLHGSYCSRSWSHVQQEIINFKTTITIKRRKNEHTCIEYIMCFSRRHHFPYSQIDYTIFVFVFHQFECRRIENVFRWLNCIFILHSKPKEERKTRKGYNLLSSHRLLTKLWLFVQSMTEPNLHSPQWTKRIKSNIFVCFQFIDSINSRSPRLFVGCHSMWNESRFQVFHSQIKLN